MKKLEMTDIDNLVLTLAGHGSNKGEGSLWHHFDSNTPLPDAIVSALSDSDLLFYLHTVGHNFADSDKVFKHLFQKLVHRKNQALSDIRLTEEIFRVHNCFFETYFGPKRACQDLFEKGIKTGDECVVAARLYGNELFRSSAGKLGPVCHLLGNYKNFFTLNYTSKAIESVDVMLWNACRSPNSLKQVSEIAEKIIIYTLAGKGKHKMLKTNSSLYSPDQLLRLDSSFLLLCHGVPRSKELQNPRVFQKMMLEKLQNWEAQGVSPTQVQALLAHFILFY